MTVQRITFEPITNWLIQYAATKIPDYRISSFIPKDSKKFIRILRTGGPSSFVTDRPQMTVEVYNEWEDEAERDADTLRSWIVALAGTTLNGVNVKRVTVNGGLANLPDDRTPELSRFTFTVALEVRGTITE